MNETGNGGGTTDIYGVSFLNTNEGYLVSPILVVPEGVTTVDFRYVLVPTGTAIRLRCRWWHSAPAQRCLPTYSWKECIW